MLADLCNHFVPGGLQRLVKRSLRGRGSLGRALGLVGLGIRFGPVRVHSLDAKALHLDVVLAGGGVPGDLHEGMERDLVVGHPLGGSAEEEGEQATDHSLVSHDQQVMAAIHLREDVFQASEENREK